MGEGEKLLERARRSRSGWRESEIESLFLSFGFLFREGKKHRKYWHPRHPELYTFVPRHRDVRPVYVAVAYGLICRLKEMEQNDG